MVMVEGWKSIKLSDLCDVKGGKRLPKGYFLSKKNSGYPYIRVADMKNGYVELEDIHYVPTEAVNKIRNYRIAVDDLFISVAGTLGLVGEIPRILNNANLTENANKLTNIICDKKYLMYFLMSEKIQNVISGISTVGAQPKLALTRIKNFDVDIPESILEQKAVSSCLSDIDSLISFLDKLIEKKKLIKQGTMQELLLGKKRINGFDGDWINVNLSEYSKIKARIGWQGLTTEEYLEQGYAYLVTGTDFLDGRIDWDNCHFVNEERFAQDKNIQIMNGDILITKDGTIGKVAYVMNLNSCATLNSGVFVIRAKTIESYNSGFVYYILKSSIFTDFLNKLSAGSTINHLYQKDFVNFTFDIPQDIEEQKAIAEILFDMDSEITTLESKSLKYRQIKQGMMQELLTGRIRLI